MDLRWPRVYRRSNVGLVFLSFEMTYSQASFIFTNYTPCFNEVERGVYWFHLVRLSFCPSVDRIVSNVGLQQYSSDPFHICTSYQATWEGVLLIMPFSKFKSLKFWRILCNFDFVFFWLGIQYDSMVWVIMRRRGYLQNASILDVLVICQAVLVSSKC